MSVIYSGTIVNLHDGITEEFEVYKGLDMQLVLSFQREWSDVLRARLEDIILNRAKTQDELINMIEESQLGDAHWDWSRKMLSCYSDKYDWFFIKINGKVEAVCIILHPHNSKIDDKDIFYVDYLAVAPWNRNTPYGRRKYALLGTTLLSVCCNQSKVDLPYRYGFSLHSLPQSLTYYTRIGMDDYGRDIIKENLNYLEMSEENSKKLVAEYVI